MPSHCYHGSDCCYDCGSRKSKAESITTSHTASTSNPEITRLSQRIAEMEELLKDRERIKELQQKIKLLEEKLNND